MIDDADAGSPPEPPRRCPGCNQRFAAAGPDPVCPTCGAAPADSPRSPHGGGETLDLAETQLGPVSDGLTTGGFGSTASDRPAARNGAAPPAARHDGDFDEHLGEELHVYRFEHLLGRGGMGRVYLARHRDLLRRCALKVLSPRVGRGDVDFVDRFQQEGRASAGLSHPNLVVTHAIGEERGFPLPRNGVRPRPHAGPAVAGGGRPAAGLGDEPGGEESPRVSATPTAAGSCTATSSRTTCW